MNGVEELVVLRRLSPRDSWTVNSRMVKGRCAWGRRGHTVSTDEAEWEEQMAAREQ
jgi:hypothetical protein